MSAAAGPMADNPTPIREARAGTWLLAAGVAAGPLYVVVSLAQAVSRPGFDLSRHPWSVLANGELGWIQVVNLTLTGLLVVAFSAGARRVLTAGPGSRWAPRLIGVYGLSLIAAGLLRADPVAGFPLGTPATPAVSWHGLAHLVAGAVGFLCLTAGCLLLAHRFGTTDRGWAVATAGAGIAFLGAFAGIASGGGSPVSVVVFVAAVLIIWAWFTAYALHLLRTTADR